MAAPNFLKGNMNWKHFPPPWGWGCGWSHSPSGLLLLPLPSPCPSTGHSLGCSPSVGSCAHRQLAQLPGISRRATDGWDRKLCWDWKGISSFQSLWPWNSLLGMGLEDSCNSVFATIWLQIVWFGDSWFCQTHRAPGTVYRSQGRSSCIFEPIHHCKWQLPSISLWHLLGSCCLTIDTILEPPE